MADWDSCGVCTDAQNWKTLSFQGSHTWSLMFPSVPHRNGRVYKKAGDSQLPVPPAQDVITLQNHLFLKGRDV